MGIKKAELAFAEAAEKANPDRQGRAAAFSKLLTEVQRVVEAAGWKALTFGHQQVHQIVIVMPPGVQQLTLKLGDRSEPRWDRGPMPQDEGTLDCLIYNVETKLFGGIWDGMEVDAVDALAGFIVSKLRLPLL